MQEITDTGIRGFLKWLKTVQPGIYAKVAPQLATKTPAAFSDYHAGGWRIAGLSHSQAVARLNGLGDTTNSLGISSPTIDSMAFDPNSVSAPAPVDVSTAANSGSGSTSTTDLIGSIIQGVSSLYLTKQQANIQQQVVNTQLQRAALGLPPLPTSLTNLGVPQVSVGLSTGTGGALAIAGVGIAGLILFSMLGKRRG